MPTVPHTEAIARHAIHIVLFEPEIPPNTGNIARLCAATTTELHLIEPLGFSLDDRYLKRAGLDYWAYVKLSIWKNFDAYLQSCGSNRRLIATSSRQGSWVHKFSFTPHDSLVLGPETRGLPESIVSKCNDCIRIPIWGTVRSLNLSTAAGILLYSALGRTGVADALLPD